MILALFAIPGVVFVSMGRMHGSSSLSLKAMTYTLVLYPWFYSEESAILRQYLEYFHVKTREERKKLLMYEVYRLMKAKTPGLLMRSSGRRGRCWVHASHAAAHLC